MRCVDSPDHVTRRDVRELKLFFSPKRVQPLKTLDITSAAAERVCVYGCVCERDGWKEFPKPTAQGLQQKFSDSFLELILLHTSCSRYTY